MNKKMLGVTVALGSVLVMAGTALAACEGNIDEVFSFCDEDGTAGQMTNGERIIVDLARGSSAQGHAFGEDGDEIFVCAIEDTEEGLGNRSNTAELNCVFTVAAVQVTVD